MEHRKQENNPPAEGAERRFFTGGLEIRAGQEGEPEIFGYALKFGVVYDMGWFTEEVHRDALKNADMSDVRVLQDHMSHLILGRTKSGTASVGVDDTGLWYRARLPKSPNGENMRVSVERGDVDQSSWGFMLRRTENSNGDAWEKRGGKDHRILMDVHTVFDASAVTFPANPDTTVAKRSLELRGNEYPPESTSSTDFDLQIRERRLRLLQTQIKTR